MLTGLRMDSVGPNVANVWARPLSFQSFRLLPCAGRIDCNWAQTKHTHPAASAQIASCLLSPSLFLRLALWTRFFLFAFITPQRPCSRLRGLLPPLITSSNPSPHRLRIYIHRHTTYPQHKHHPALFAHGVFFPSFHEFLLCPLCVRLEYIE